VIALAEATIDAAGQAAGLASKTAEVQAFCNVVNLDGSCFGRSTLTLEMFASSVCERVMPVGLTDGGKGHRGCFEQARNNRRLFTTATQLS